MNRHSNRKQRFIIATAIASVLVIIFAVRYVKINLSGKPENAKDSTQEELLSGENPSEDEILSEEASGDANSPTEPSSEENTTPAPPENYEDIRLAFGGNLIMSEELVNKLSIGESITQGLQSYISNHDFSMLNLQSAFADPITMNMNTDSDKYYTGDSEAISALGFQGVALANNYIMEAGKNTLDSTLETLDNANILHTGAGEDFSSASKPILLEMYGKKICILSCCRNVPDDSWIAADAANGKEKNPGILSCRELDDVTSLVQTYKKQCDFVIVYMNCGEEASESLDIYQQHVSHHLADAGADLVIGCFPTVVQGIEYYNGTPIVYSLGNFIAGEAAGDSMILSVSIKEDNSAVFTVFPCTFGAHGISFMEENREAGFYEHLNGLSNKLNAAISPEGVISPANPQS